MRTRVCAIALVALSAAVGGCGESKDERAQQEICDARADITEQIGNLQNLSFGKTGLREAQSDLDAIKGDLETIKKFQGDLEGDRKSQVQTATQAFADQVDSLTQSAIAAGVSGSTDAISGLKTAVKQLGDSYQKALEPLDCGDN